MAAFHLHFLSVISILYRSFIQTFFASWCISTWCRRHWCHVTLTLFSVYQYITLDNIEMNFIFMDLIDVYINSGESLRKWIMSEILKNNNSFLIIPTLSSKCYKCCQKMSTFETATRKEIQWIYVSWLYRPLQCYCFHPGYWSRDHNIMPRDQ